MSDRTADVAAWLLALFVVVGSLLLMVLIDRPVTP